ncbi:hypothetical protein POVWA2_004770 [Plasmodium ovale wallikeri]|uniref:PIR Superfamily Protein n=1 Tax=Plasmodium ovale wallikeri TaxID=864142 RepID=A0A1A8YJ37_PLAOA|nr:hypothetical protein POVWA1_004710 [Plasmodium ovale wallikeri]SBT31553.1 hypothetical protein POVWA2_004770 [Plasmodium ovale wallikeri]
MLPNECLSRSLNEIDRNIWKINGNENYLSRTKVTSDTILGHISSYLSENDLDRNKEYNFENTSILRSTVCSHFNRNVTPPPTSFSNKEIEECIEFISNFSMSIFPNTVAKINYSLCHQKSTPTGEKPVPKSENLVLQH